jgi:hypothetical protein
MLSRMTMPPPPRWFKAADVLSGQVQLHSFPGTFVAVGAVNVMGARALEMTMAAAELLEAQGWRVVNFADEGKLVFLRRDYRPAPMPPQQYPGQ